MLCACACVALFLLSAKTTNPPPTEVFDCLLWSTPSEITFKNVAVCVYDCFWDCMFDMLQSSAITKLHTAFVVTSSKIT